MGSPPKRSYEFTIKFDPAVYSLQAIKNAAYDFTSKAFIEIETAHNGFITANIRAKSEQASDSIADEFKNQVLDHQIRIDTNKEYKTIREMIVAQAFEPCDNLIDIIRSIE
jgi:His-Xaa-Ser system protein HxsD